MSALKALREKAWDALAHTGFLRRGENNAALFVSDYPRRGGEISAACARLNEAGFAARAENGLLLIDLLPACYPAWRAFEPVRCRTDGEYLLCSLARRLLAFDTPPECQAGESIRMTLLMLDQRKYELLYDLLAPRLAEALRTGGPMPVAAGVYIMDALKEENA